MKKSLITFCVAALLAGSLAAADSSSKDAVTSAAKQLADKPNYSWTTTIVVPESAQFRPGPTEGRIEKDGLTFVKATMRDNTLEFVIKGDKAAVTSPDGGWQSLSEIDDSDWPGRFIVGMVRGFRSPAAQAIEIAASAKELKKDGDAYSGDLTEDGARTLLTYRRSGDLTASNAKGSVKFWVKDGVLSKYEFKVTGTVSFNGNDRDVDRTTTVEIKGVGATKVEVPEEAKKKLS